MFSKSLISDHMASFVVTLDKFYVVLSLRAGVPCKRRGSSAHRHWSQPKDNECMPTADTPVQMLACCQRWEKIAYNTIGDKSTVLSLLVRVERCTCSPFSTGFTLSHLDLLISSTTVIRLCNVSWLQKITATKHSTLYNKSNKHHMVHIRDIKSQSLHTLNELYRMVLVMKGERFVYEFHSSANWLHILGTSVIE